MQWRHHQPPASSSSSLQPRRRGLRVLVRPRPTSHFTKAASTHKDTQSPVFSAQPQFSKRPPRHGSRGCAGIRDTDPARDSETVSCNAEKGTRPIRTSCTSSRTSGTRRVCVSGQVPQRRSVRLMPRTLRTRQTEPGPSPHLARAKSGAFRLPE
ncbi:hypothetical protein AOLI_G00100640 [Acnodon oligacanthus]